jgi:hypothetical protein
MIRTRKPVVLGLLLLLAATSAPAQDGEFGLRFLTAEPAGPFGEAVDNLGFGASIHVGVRTAYALTFGFGLQYMIYGRETTEHALPLVEPFDLTTINNLGGGFLLAHWRPLGGAVQPYGESRLGLNYLWTESKLEDDSWWNDGEVARKTNHDDFAGFWSLGGGLLIRLSRGDHAADRPGVLLDFKVTNQHGGRAEYLTEGDITLVDDRPVFAASRSETDMVIYEFGVVLTF